MTPDPLLLRALIDASPLIDGLPGGAPGEWIAAAEATVGPLPASYRWWLGTYRAGRVGVGVLADVAPPPHHDDTVEDITAGWRRADQDRLWFCAESDGGGDRYGFALDRSRGAEYEIVRRDPWTGEEEPFADTFAGFLTVCAARESGFRDGPVPDLARLWRTAPGVRLGNGTTVYGPHVLTARNTAHRVRDRAPHWTLVGDDGAGHGYLTRHHGRDRTSVYRADLGALDGDAAATGERVTGDLVAWLSGLSELSDPA
ncbi:SMI1/KNR4 family protein [Streptomyces sp. SID4919]|uniref:SMI1/KNR4 family protein n=1 Tax=unclassified Streptomyces TaxID=2593676 RepID=UPI000823A26F|nr:MULTISPECIES: SMI1/KNR4 family protein [unclassified Streptomyces]MYY13940.1 SMI1/KNR4 family protein [Streptomyces sp. SID4919]SCK31603.1 hypothetical protein YW7DRAFT_02528 [Streptomyces sp. AmelKG-E11A]